MKKKNLSEFWKLSIQLPGLYNWEEAKKACPKGWRSPAKEEWGELLENTTYSFDKILKQGVFTFEDGFELRLPAAGCRDYGSGSSNDLASYGYYWSSTLNASGKSPKLAFNSSNAYTGESSLAYGFSVRCVQELSEANCRANSNLRQFDLLKIAIQLGKYNPNILSMDENELRKYINLAKMLKDNLW